MIDIIRSLFWEISLVYYRGEKRHWNQEVQLKGYLKNDLFSGREREREGGRKRVHVRASEQTP